MTWVPPDPIMSPENPVLDPVIEPQSPALQSAWATEQLAALEEAETESAAAVYSLNFLWLEKNIGVSIDQIFNGVRTPVPSSNPSSSCALSKWW